MFRVLISSFSVVLLAGAVLAEGALSQPMTTRRTNSAPAATETSVTPSPTNRLSILDAERATLKSLSMTADIMTPKSNNRWATIPMEFQYRASNLYRSVIKTGGLEGDLIIVADGTSIWEYSTKKREVVKRSQVAVVESIRTAGPTDLLTVLATPTLKLAELFSMTSALLDSGQYVLDIKPRIAVSTYDRIVLRTSADGKSLLFAEATKAGKVVARVQFKDYTRDPELADALFKFDVPDGVRIKEGN